MNYNLKQIDDHFYIFNALHSNVVKSRAKIKHNKIWEIFVKFVNLKYEL